MRRLHQGALVTATALAAAACYTMRPVTYDELGAARAGAVEITRADHSVVVVETPRVFGDTLTGYVNGKFREMRNTGMTQFRVRRMAPARTTALVLTGMLGFGTFAFLASSTNDYLDPTVGLDCEDPQTPGCPNANP